MAYTFKIVDRKNDQFGVQFLYNSEVMVWSESYKGKASANNCVESLKKNAPGAAVVDVSAGESGSGYRFEIVGSKDGQHYVRFVAANGEPMVISETYKSKASAKNCIESCQKQMADADVVDRTTDSEYNFVYPEMAFRLEGDADAHIDMVRSLIMMVGQAHTNLSNHRPNDRVGQTNKEEQLVFLQSVLQKLIEIEEELASLGDSPHPPDDILDSLSFKIMELAKYLTDWARNHPEQVARIVRVCAIGGICAFLRYCGIPGEIAAGLAIYSIGGTELALIIKQFLTK